MLTRVELLVVCVFVAAIAVVTAMPLGAGKPADVMVAAVDNPR